MRHTIFTVLLCAFLCFACVPAAGTGSPVASDIAAETVFSGVGYADFSFLSDKNENVYERSFGSTSIVLENESGMASLYLLFQFEYGAYTVKNNATGATVTAGENGFLHEYIDLKTAFGTLPTSVTLSFENGAVQLSEIYVFSRGKVPDFVQVWQPPLEEGADIVLFSTHGDDEHLFFAGLLPLYAGEKGARVQVVYLTDHRNRTLERTHEMLNGLWNVGVTAYPVFGDFADFRIDSREGTYSAYLSSYGTTKDDLQAFVVEQIRRFKPLVAVGHDINGEYGHGMHQVYADLLIKSLDMTGDAAAFPDSAAQYGTWTLPKLYLHLYGENTIRLDYDQPLAAFDGMTAFEVSQKLGYPCHVSQQNTWFTAWLCGYGNEITQATQIARYNPCLFGLYHSTVGPDIEKNDFLENLTLRGEQQPQTEPTVAQPLPTSNPSQPLPIAQTEPVHADERPSPSSIVLPIVLIAVVIFTVYLIVYAKNQKRRRNSSRRSARKRS